MTPLTPAPAVAPSPALKALLEVVRFNDAGLVPAIAQQWDSLEVLMMAWMNAESLAQTLTTGTVCYFSRSRQSLWRKGETSGHWQRLKELRVDCDGDTLLLLVDQTGAACHTGARSCFYRKTGPEEPQPAAQLNPSVIPRIGG